MRVCLAVFRRALRVVVTGHDDDARVPPQAADVQLFQQMPSVHLRHHQVEDDELGNVLDDHLERLTAVGRGRDLMSFALKDGPDEHADTRFVIDDQDARHEGHLSCLEPTIKRGIRTSAGPAPAPCSTAEHPSPARNIGCFAGKI